MVLKQRLKFLRFSLLIFCPFLLQAQSWEKIKQVQIAKSPISYSVDYQGNFYLGFSDGGLIKYNSEGDLLENFSLSNASSITLIDVQNNLKPFLFYFDNQQITILDRFSTVPKNYPLSDLGVQLGMMACPAPDGDFWIVENNPQRLKKINPARKNLILEVQVNIGDSLQRMQAYQNLLFVAHSNGLHTFDQYGGKLYSIALDDLISMQLSQGKLMLFSSKKILQINPINGKILNELATPTSSPDGILKIGNHFLVINERTLTFFNLIE
ncbi:hypothetical protein [Ekhidna sp. MALMAid0563]|uniref:hypothetical protein n=1 Tax=Ekhidna sp. MALMAid0563 TaxID=3143937 RepID=UPI0032E053F7